MTGQTIKCQYADLGQRFYTMTLDALVIPPAAWRETEEEEEEGGGGGITALVHPAPRAPVLFIV